MDSIQINGETRLYGIIGNPLGHSFSPDMHTRAFQHIQFNAVYLPFPVQELDLPFLPRALSTINARGFNVTIPYKEKIIPFLDELSPEARILGSVNTVVHSRNGWKGFSTDGSGFVRAAKAEGLSFQGKSVLLIGGGGSAKSVALAVAKEGAACMTILNRTAKKAESIASMLKQNTPHLEIKLEIDRRHNYDFLVNCTSVGMKKDDCPVNDDIIQMSNYVIDIIYNPISTLLMLKAQNFGMPTFNGIGMLLYQGIEAFEIWTDRSAPIEVMRRSLYRSLEKLK